MKSLILRSLLAAGALALFACNSSNPDRQGPAEGKKPVEVQGALNQTLQDPKVNILFVVDNSGSMQPYQEKMARNIGLFAEHFLKNSRIDYRIGVVPVYDSKYLNDKTMYRSGLRKMNPLGELVALKGRSDEDTGSPLFVTRNTLNAKEVLIQTVAIGTQWGPEAEESFSPVLAVMDPQINQEKNGGFYEEDAYLVVIFLTDADDVTPGLSGEEFYEQLIQMKKGNRNKVLLAAALPLNDAASCTKDGSGPRQSFPALIAASGATKADLCSESFGTHLADFGRYLVQRVGSQKIALNFTPDIESLEVTYGLSGSKKSERILLKRTKGDYSFAPETNEIVINPELNILRQEGAVILVEAIPANLEDYTNGRLEEI